MSTYDKLVDLITDAENDFYGKTPHATDEARIAQVVDHLIANGVTVKAMQKPLTVEELPEYLGEIIWKEEPSMELVPVKMFFVGSIAAEYGEFGIAEDCESLIGDYNYSWRFWAEKPTEEERKAAEWEWE
jgi:hypothetical protein